MPPFRFPDRLLLAALLALSSSVHACRFAASTPPDEWYKWSQALFAGDVTAVVQDRAKGLDVVSVGVVETFKGPNAATTTVEIPSRMWADCRLPQPAVGDRVLVALSPNSDALVIPLPPSLAEQLRARRKAM